MTMNIKNEEAHKLARQLARLTGESLTETVTDALREKLERIKIQNTERLSARLLEIGGDCSARLKGRFRSIDHGDLLYDEKGLPK